MIEKKTLGFTFIKTNPVAENFNVNRVMNLVYMHIKQSTKNHWLMIFQKQLFGLEFEKTHLIKSKCLKFIVKKALPTI